jgi:hypothetical protein
MTMTMGTIEFRQPVPFKREQSAPLQLPPGNLFTRILTARIIASMRKTSALEVARERYPNDRIVAEWITRASVAPAMTSVAGWAAELVQTIVPDGLSAMGPASAAGAILRQGLVLTFEAGASVSVPGMVIDFGSANTGWVAEGQPIPVRGLNLAPKTMTPHKLALITVLTREMIESSNAEALVTDALMKAAGRIADEVLFDANPGDATRPPGLRYGVAATTASNNSDAAEAVFEDFAALINKLAPVGGNGPYIFIASPGRAALLGARTGGQYGVTGDTPNVQFLGSSAVINDLLAVAPGALAVAAAPEAETETSTGATVVMEDTTPAPAGAAGPERSIYQTDSIAIKMRWPITWVLRDPRGFAWMTPGWKAITPP